MTIFRDILHALRGEKKNTNKVSKEEDILFNLTIEKIKESPIYDNLSEEFKKDLPLILEDIKKNHSLLCKLRSL